MKLKVSLHNFHSKYSHLIISSLKSKLLITIVVNFYIISHLRNQIETIRVTCPELALDDLGEHPYGSWPSSVAHAQNLYKSFIKPGQNDDQLDEKLLTSYDEEDDKLSDFVLQMEESEEDGNLFLKDLKMKSQIEGLEAGRPMIKEFTATVDGNYVLLIRVRGNEKLAFHDLMVGECRYREPGNGGNETEPESESHIKIANSFTRESEITVDLEACQPNENKISSYTVKDEDNLINILNAPIEISFSLLEPDLYENQETRNQIAAKYSFTHSTKFADKYKVTYLSIKNESVSNIYNAHGRTEYQPNNLQLSMVPLNDTEDGQGILVQQAKEKGFDIFIKITPINGFNLNLMSFYPISCSIRDPWLTNKNIQLWRMGGYNTKDCYTDIEYVEPDVINQLEVPYWTFGLNYTKLLGPETTPKDSVISCEVKLCGNIKNNQCSQMIENCGYKRGEGVKNGFKLMPTEPSLRPL